MTGSSEVTDARERVSANTAYRAGLAFALVTAFLTVWTTVVRDDGSGMSYFMLVMAAVVGAFAAWFRPAGMARTMVGVAVMQLLLGVAVATAPVTAILPNGALKALLLSGVFAALWLTSGACFRAASKRESGSVAAD